MKTVQIYKAQRTIKAIGIPSVTIVIDTEMPETDNLKEAGTIYTGDAAAICDALEKSLPGGTFDRLVLFLLEKTVSHFSVSHKE